MNKCIALAFLLFPVTSQVFGQVLPSGSTLLSKSVDQTYQLYAQTMGTQSHLYSGIEYVEYDNHMKGHPFFESNELEEASVYYDGTLYHHVPLLYDLRYDVVLTEHNQGPYKIQLHSEKVDYFVLLNHTFVRLSPDSAASMAIRPGFYDQLHKGNIALVAKRIKTIEESIEDRQVKRSILEKNRYYIVKDGQYHPVKRKRSVMQVLADHRKELAQYLKSNHIRYRKAPEQTMIQLVQQYDRL